MNILEVKNLNIEYQGIKGRTTLLKDVSFQVEKGKCLCVLGESGSGKSITMKAVMGLLDKNFKINGHAELEGMSLLEQDKETLRKIRGTKLTMILQNPMVCFDSLYRIGDQIKETLQVHTSWSSKEIEVQTILALEKMRIKDPTEVLKKYPHQLSGGMLQRIMIGIALMLNPSVLIADEPTTAIDAITQLEIMEEFKRLKQEKTTMIFITHDIGIASLIADQVIVLNKGEVVDRGTFQEILTNPKDEYTRLLIEKRRAVMKAYQKAIGGKN